jgi:hypothetical protein
VVGNGNPIVGIIPPRGSTPNEYCQREGDVLFVAFENTGQAPAPPGTDVTVDFRDSNSVTQTRGGIPAGGVVEMAFEIPPDCFNPDGCVFSIRWSNQPEVSGRCF